MHLCVNARCTKNMKRLVPKHAVRNTLFDLVSVVHLGSDNKYGMSMFSSWPFKLGSETLRDRGGKRRRDDYSKDCTRGATGAMVMRP